MQSMDLIYLHVPHTGGRAIRSAIWDQDLKNVHYVHNDEQISEVKEKNQVDWDTTLKYFVKRPVVERVVGQYVHYSRRIQNGPVNGMVLSKIQERFTNFDPSNPIHFMGLEENRNMYCKFIIGSTDFTKPITDKDFAKIIAVKDTLRWDEFIKPVKVDVLEGLLKTKLAIPEVLPRALVRGKPKQDEILLDKNFVAWLEKINEYDVAIFSFIR